MERPVSAVPGKGIPIIRAIAGGLEARISEAHDVEQEFPAAMIAGSINSSLEEGTSAQLK